MNELLELFDYNGWANRTIFDAVARLPDEQYFRDLKSSYGGIHGTLCHIVWAEQLWLHRWLVKPNPPFHKEPICARPPKHETGGRRSRQSGGDS